MEKIKIILSIILGAISAFAQKYSIILVFVTLVIVFDVITGLVKAKAIGEAITSKRGAKGFYKKMALFIALVFGFFLDYFIPYMLSTIGVTLPVSAAIFGMIIGCYIVINESISICENLYAINPDIMPHWITKLLTSAKEQIDKKGEQKNEEADGL